LPGAPFPEIAETRRRLRYAVLAAMHFRGFMPGDETHIGYFNSCQAPFTSVLTANNNSALTANSNSVVTANNNNNKKSRPAKHRHLMARIVLTANNNSVLTANNNLCIDSTGEATHAVLLKTIPFEQFEAIEKSGPHVLLLWLDEDFLTSARRPIA